MNEQFIANWIIALRSLLGQLDIDYYLPETDPNWWAIYLWVKRN